jgi:antitoxin VapB
MKTATVVSEPDGQTIRLPVDVRLSGDEVFVKQIGPSVILIPKQHNPWQSLVESLDQFSDDFMQDRAQPAEQSRTRAFE